jgi:hypothetical protein
LFENRAEKSKKTINLSGLLQLRSNIIKKETVNIGKR